MTEKESGLFASAPEAVFYLVSDAEAVEESVREKVEVLDDRPGVQVTMDLERLADPDLYDRILSEAKLGSRWGKDVSTVYRDYLRSRTEQVDESVLIDEFETQFSRYDADPYESAVLGDALTIGIDLTAQIQKKLDQWTEHQFTRDDLAAAVGISARSENLTGKNTYGRIIFRSKVPLSDLKQQRSVLRASQHLQQLLFIGLDVAIVAPVGGPDEQEVVEQTFRSVGSFSVEAVAGIEFDVADDVATAVDDWYDRLQYDVADNRVIKQVVRPASVTAYDLPDEPWASHFRNAITLGLQGAYSEKIFNKDRFYDFWNKRIIPHSNYDPYRSRHNTFPEVKVTRKKDEITREFVLHHQGPSAETCVCNLPAKTSNPEKELVDRIERFLDAEHVSDQQWRELVDLFTELAQTLEEQPENLAANALLLRDRRRHTLSPLIPAKADKKNIRSVSVENSYGDEWYEEHWSTILAGFEITKQGGVGAIERKRELQNSLNPNIPADEALYYKLERDIENAWEYFLDGVEAALQRSVTDKQNLSVETRETRFGREVEVIVASDKGPARTATIEVLLPFSEVYMEGKRVRTATVTNTVSELLDGLGTSNHWKAGDLLDEQKIDFLYEATTAYLQVADFEPGDLVYFDDVIEFCLSLPNVQDLFETPDQAAEPVIREYLGSERYMSQVREGSVTFHRKGSDRHGSVKVRGDRYIAMELQELLT